MKVHVGKSLSREIQLSGQREKILWTEKNFGKRCPIFFFVCKNNRIFVPAFPTPKAQRAGARQRRDVDCCQPALRLLQCQPHARRQVHPSFNISLYRQTLYVPPD